MSVFNPHDIRAVIIGAGNVATHFAIGLHRAGFNVDTVVARHIESAALLADKIGAKAVLDLNEVDPDTDLVIIATSDAAVGDVSSVLPCIRGIVAHTSGSVPLDVVAAHHRCAGVIYPLQTFSRDSDVDMSRVPFFTEATDSRSLEIIDEVAGMFGGPVHHAGSDIRARLHIAGVFACNFAVYMFEMARRELGSVGLSLDTVRPLVDVTVEKAFDIGPRLAMTGAARRGDKDTIGKQMSLIERPDEKEIYAVISQAIYNEFNKQDEQNTI